MKRITYLLISFFVLISCTEDNVITPDYSDIVIPGGGTIPGGGGSSSATNVYGNLATFAIAVNTEALSETETITTDETDEYYGEYWENDFSEKTTVTLNYSEGNVTIDGTAEGVDVSVDGAHAVVNATAKGLVIKVCGTTTDGSLKIYSDKKFKLVLSDANITNPTGPAINIQNGNAFVVVEDGTTNTLADGANYVVADGEDAKGAFFSEDKLRFSGSGELFVFGYYKNGICSDDYIYIRPNTNIYVKSVAGHGIKTNDGVIIRGGVLNVEVSAQASKAINTEGYFFKDGGRTTLISSGNAVYDSDDNDVTGAAGLKVDSIFTMAGGELNAKSTGKGGKGISVDQTFTITDGSINVITEGSTYTYNSSLDSKAKGIKADGAMSIAGGNIMVRALGGEGCEGIESKSTMTISGGEIATYTYDDGINSKGDLTISGGQVYCLAIGNDGIDSNGNFYITGGVVVAIGSSGAEEGLDVYEGKTMSITGGTVIGLGGGNEAASGSQQKAVAKGITASSGSYLAITDGTNCIFALALPRSLNNETLVVSSPSFKSSTTYSIYTATSATGTSFYGFVPTATLSGTSNSPLGTFTTSTTISGGMGGGMGGPGGGGFH